MFLIIDNIEENFYFLFKNKFGLVKKKINSKKLLNYFYVHNFVILLNKLEVVGGAFSHPTPLVRISVYKVLQYLNTYWNTN